MQDFFYRTEDIRPEDVLDYYVETQTDRGIVEALKSKNPTVLVGSRGVGKSFLLRVAEQELSASFSKSSILPVYVTFSKSILVDTADKNQFSHWMLARICSRLIRALKQKGLIVSDSAKLFSISGGTISGNDTTKIEQITSLYEQSWKGVGHSIDTSAVPSIEEFKDTVEDVCQDLGIGRITFFLDEVAHIFRPEQQRQFFTLFRDLRSPYITCNAAVYPGITAFGQTFQPAHDATFIDVERDVLSSEYIGNMREIVEKQATSDVITSIIKNAQNFSVLAYASNGNPRLLLKTLSKCPKLNSKEVNETIKEFYRTEIWTEHSGLGANFLGHQELIDWGRKFIEDSVLPELQKKNTQYISESQKTSCYFWIHRSAPEAVRESLRLLTYTGIVNGHTDGIKATRSELGTRYAVNLGCLMSLEPHPIKTGFDIAKNLSPKKVTEFGARHADYNAIQEFHPVASTEAWSSILNNQLVKSIDILDLTNWEKGKLKEINLTTIGKVLESTYGELRKIYYVGEVRSKRIYNAAQAAIYEYLSG